MFVNKVQLTNFQRFTDVTVDISTTQPTLRLVLLIGANGSGKNGSVFTERVIQES